MKTHDLNDPESKFQPAYIPKFENPEQFTDEKIDMLRKHFRIRLTNDEINHLYSLKTEYEINAAVRTILNNHWK